jgi:hypothetical protein
MNASEESNTGAVPMKLPNKIRRSTEGGGGWREGP